MQVLTKEEVEQLGYKIVNNKNHQHIEYRKIGIYEDHKGERGVFMLRGKVKERKKAESKISPEKQALIEKVDELCRKGYVFTEILKELNITVLELEGVKDYMKEPLRQETKTKEEVKARRMKVQEMLKQGLSIREIANQLLVTYGTVHADKVFLMCNYNNEIKTKRG